MTKKRPGRMAKLGEQVYKETDQELADEEVKLLKETSIDWETLRPQVTNNAIYDQLIAEVNEATQRNESKASVDYRDTDLCDAYVLWRTVTRSQNRPGKRECCC